MIVDILVLDDEVILRESLRDWLAELPALGGELRLAAIRIVLAGTGREAIEALRGAAASGRPFDVFLADLEVPEHEYSIRDVRTGLDVINQARILQGAREILVTSSFLTKTLGDRDVFSHSLLNGATDLLPRNLRKEQFHDHIIRSLQRGIARRSSAMFAGRIRDLVPHAEHTLVYHFGLRFARCIQAVGRAERSIRDEALRRWNVGAEDDQDDLLLTQLGEIRHAVDTGRTDWNRLRATRGFAAESSPERVDVRQILQELATELEPCFTTKRARLDVDDVPAVAIQSFDGDVRALLKEMLLGGIAELPDFGVDEATLDVTGTAEDDWIELSLRDNLQRLTSADVALINDGCGPEPAQRFSRTWGLSVMQYVALRGGGRLTVGSDTRGNLTSYRVPLAHRA